MTLSNWTGAGRSNLLRAAANWSAGVPGAGDAGLIGSGTARLAGGSLAATLYLAGTDAASAPVLELDGATQVTVSMTPPAGVGPVSTHPTFGTLHVHGHATASLSGGGFQAMPGNLVADLDAGSVFSPSGALLAGSSLAVNGGAGAALTGAALDLVGASAAVHASVKGANDFELGAAMHGLDGTLELDGTASAATTVHIAAGTLLLDQPAAFKGTVDFFAGPPGVPLGSGYSLLELNGATAASYSYDAVRDLLSFFDGSGQREFGIHLDIGSSPVLTVQAGAHGIVVSDIPNPGGMSAIPALPGHLA